MDELAQCVLFASGNINNGSNEEEDLTTGSRNGSLFSQQHDPAASGTTAATIPPIPIAAIQQAARHYRASALLGPVPLPAESSSSSSGAARAWTNFEEKYHGVGEPTFELVLERQAPKHEE